MKRFKRMSQIALSLLFALNLNFVAYADNVEYSKENTSEISSSFTADDDLEVVSEMPEMENEAEAENLSIRKLNADYEKVSDVEINDDMPAMSGYSARLAGHNTANTALFLDSNYMGNVLTDNADENENWYYFNNPSQSKISVCLEPPTDGDYDIYLYKYNEGSLALVSYSEYAGNAIMENLSCVAEADYYFLRVVPYTAPSEEATYKFIISLTSNYDSGEPDDYVDFANEYTDSISTSQTIDNVFDVDYFKLNISSKQEYRFSLNNVIDGAEYALVVYDENLNTLGSFVSTGSATGAITLDTGIYYIKVFSYNGVFSDTQNYTLSTVTYYPSVEGGLRYLALGGQTVEICNHAIYIDGDTVNLNWEYKYRSPGTTTTGYYTRTQGIHTDSDTSILLNAANIKKGSFSGYCGSSENAFSVYLTDFWYSYYYYAFGMGTDQYETLDVDSPSYWRVFIDVDNKKVIDIENNWYYLNTSNTYNFTEK